MNKRLVTLTICWIFTVVLGLAVQSSANNESETIKKAEQHFEKAIELRKAANYDAAITEYEKVISLSPDSEIAQNALYWKGQSHFKAGQLDAALSAFQKLLDEYPTSKIVSSTKRMIERAEKAKDANLFLEAIKKGDIERINKLISQGADVNAKDNRGMTPLHKAAYYGQRQMAEVLIGKGANVNETDTAGRTPLHIAANFGSKWVPELLLANGASISARDMAGNTPLHAAVCWRGSAPEKDLLELLFAKGADVNARNDAGQTPLHRVSMTRKQDTRPERTAEVLLAHGAEFDAKDKSGNTPIHFAVKNGHRKLIDLLQAKGAIISKDDNFLADEEASLYAVWRYDAYHLELLLDYGADVNTADRFGWSLLHYTAYNDKANMTKMLLEKGANPNIVERTDGRTPLHYAALEGQKTIAEMLLAHGANMDTKDWYGKTPLSLAKEAGHTEIVELLRKHGAKE
jgi:ankyrin repeat protein